MASVRTNKKTGVKDIQFKSLDGKRRTLCIGKVDMKQAKTAKLHIEALIASKVCGGTPNPATLEYVADLPDVIHERLAKTGLVEPRGEGRSVTLKAWCDRYMSQRTDLAETSIKKIQLTIDRLTGFFGKECTLASVTADQAAEWRVSLFTPLPTKPKGKGKGRKAKVAAKPKNKKTRLSEASVRGHCRNAKTIFGVATDRKILPDNPFKSLKSASIAANREHYVTPEQAEEILEACPDHRWRLFFGLQRYGAMRAPSETHGITWDCIDWERRRMSVYSQKTGQTRIVPIDPRLYALLTEAFEKSRPGQKRVLTISKLNRHRNFELILRRASIAPWPDLFQTLRRSCETEWASRHPQHAVSAWVGHSMKVSEQFYLQVTDDLFDAASQAMGGGNSSTVPFREKNQDTPRESQDEFDSELYVKSYVTYDGNASQSDVASESDTSGGRGQEMHKPALCNALRHNTGSCESSPTWARTTDTRINSPFVRPLTPGFQGSKNCLWVNFPVLGLFLPKKLPKMGDVASIYCPSFRR